MIITSLAIPICVLILLLLLCYPLKTLRILIKTFVAIMAIVIGLFAIGLIFASILDDIMGIFGF